MKNTFLKDYSIQFITHSTEKYGYYESAKIALEGGIRWIQLRMKDASMNEIRKEAIRIRDLCKQYQALFFIDDHVELALELHADGVHLGQMDMPMKDARKLTGKDLWIGGTANSFSQIQALDKEGADYIGLGPYRFTHTKNKLSPILGLDGIQKIILQCQLRKIELPIHVIGGIRKEDVQAILRSGVDGIAISSAILQADNPLEEAKCFLNLINNVLNP